LCIVDPLVLRLIDPPAILRAPEIAERCKVGTGAIHRGGKRIAQDQSRFARDESLLAQRTFRRVVVLEIASPIFAPVPSNCARARGHESPAGSWAY
jgi:hypothetical protein